MTKMFLDYKIKRRLAVLLTSIPDKVKKISAAVAFTQSDMLIEECIKRKIDLDWWGLFNSGISTKLDILKKAISCSHIKFYPFAEYFHPKVIHFHNYGIYIGSHNMTNSAMYKNIEAGVFIDENDLSDEHWHEINDLFDYLKDHSVPATQEDIDKIDEYIELTKIENEKREEIDTGLEELFEEQFKHLFILKSGVTDYGKEEKRDKENKRKLLFLQEWRECQNYLFIVQKYIIEKCQQPKWINPSAPMTIITDQLLHAYYYSYILKNSEEHKNIEAVNNAYHSNKRDPENAILTAIRWWETLDKALNNEDIPINEWGISNREILSKIQERDLTEDEIKQVMLHNHAARNHARQIKNKTFDLPDSYSTDEDERVKIYVSWLMKQKTESNLSVNDTIRYLLFNDQYRVEERVYECIYNPKYHLEHFGRSIVGELIGWGRPDITHLRNNRVNKALRCLGYDVRLFSE